VVKLLKFLYTVLLIAGYMAMVVLASVISHYGQQELGLGIFIAATAMILLLVIVSTVVERTNKQRLRSAQEAHAAAANSPAKVYSFQASESYDHDAHSVWSLIRPAQSAVLLADAQNAFKVPGTPSGVGEQQCFIGRDGSVSIIEVIGEESPWWATTRPIAQGEMNQRSTYRLQPTPTGCTLTYGIVIEMPGNATFADDSDDWWESHSRPYLNRIREVLGDGRAG
jgi:hypothetical protein